MSLQHFYFFLEFLLILGLFPKELGVELRSENSPFGVILSAYTIILNIMEVYLLLVFVVQVANILTSTKHSGVSYFGWQPHALKCCLLPAECTLRIKSLKRLLEQKQHTSWAT